MKTSFFTVCTLIILSAVLLSEASSKHGKNHPGAPEACGHTYTEPNGTLHWSNGSSTTVPQGKTCIWTISFEGNETENNIFLVFDELLLGPNDLITIKSEDGSLLPFPGKMLYNVHGSLPLLTGKNNITVSLSTEDKALDHGRSFQMHYYRNSACNHSISQTTSGILRSPLYPSDHPLPIKCFFKVASLDKKNNMLHLWFNKFNLTESSVTIGQALNNNGEYSATNLPVYEFLAKDELELGLKITNNTESGMFEAYFDSVRPECSNSQGITKSSAKVTLASPSSEIIQFILSSRDQKLTCLWLMQSEEGSTMTISIQNLVMPGVFDQLLFLDGSNSSSPVIADVNYENKQPAKLLYTTGNKLWVASKTPFVSENFSINIEVTQTTSGGHLRDHGTITISGEDTTTFLLEVDSGKQVRLDLDKAASLLASGSSVKFYKNFLLKDSDLFMTLTPTQMKYVVVSPTEQLAVVSAGFLKSKLLGNFSGIDQGCYKYGQGSGDIFSVSGHCNSTCAWIVEPITASNDTMAFHFQTMNLLENDQLIIHLLDPAETQVVNITKPKSFMPDLWLPANTGALVQVTRSNCTSSATVIQASYQQSSGCNTALSLKQGETIQISSPGYPNHYPLGAECTWTVAKPVNSTFLHVTLKDLQLAEANHSFEVWLSDKENLTKIYSANVSDKTLPDDIPVFGDLVLKFKTSVTPLLMSLPGFSLNVTAIDFGSVMTNSTGTVETRDFPKSINGSSIFAWVVQIYSPDTQKEILEFSFGNSTVFSSIARYLKIYDGASLRAGVISNFTEEKLLSRTNKLLFVYQSNGTAPGPAFSISYQNSPCNMSLLCHNGICMHEDWRCNGLNDCGDFTDEVNCEGGLPPPPPTPPPTPSPADVGSKGVSTAALAVGILIALVVGAILGVGAPAAYKRLRGNQFRSYSSFTNNLE